MSSMLKRSLALAAAVSMTAAALGTARVLAQAAPGGNPRWVKAAPFPEPEEELYAVTVNGKMYVIGGFGYMPFGNPPGLVYEYDPGPDKWTKKKTLPQRVHHQAQAVFNNKIYVFGGCKMGIFGTDAVTNVWEYDPATDNYRAMAPIPGPRCSAVAATANNKIYLIGGIEPFENGQGSRISGRNQVFDPVANTWGSADLSPMPTTRNHAFVGVVNNKIYVIGGRQAAGMIPYSSNTDVVEEYDPATNTWGGVKQRMPTARSGGGYATYNGRIYIGGGEWISREVMASFRALEAYEPATDTWQLLPALPGAVHGNAMTFIGNKLHNVSGKMENGGLPDQMAPATADHSTMEFPAGTGRTN
jgi:N-acetylneuraminic acid mutarotase